MTRREAIAALTAAAAGFSSCPTQGDATSEIRGCILSDLGAAHLSSDSETFSAYDSALSSRTGNPQLDRALGRGLVRISQMFGQRPGFGFVDGQHATNALATPRTEVSGTWGTVLYGRQLFDDLLTRFDDDGFAVLAIAAHEFGHIAQYRAGVTDALEQGQSTVKRVELHADLLSGYFIGVRKRQQPSISVYGAGKTFFDIGDFQFNDRNHHGTPDERAWASEIGFNWGKSNSHSFDQAFSAGVELILASV